MACKTTGGVKPRKTDQCSRKGEKHRDAASYSAITGRIARSRPLEKRTQSAVRAITNSLSGIKTRTERSCRIENDFLKSCGRRGGVRAESDILSVFRGRKE